MKAYRIFESDSFGKGEVVDLNQADLCPGDVTIKVEYSGINFKDALAGLGKGKILKKYPLNGGIDCAGEVTASSDASVKVGDVVLVNGSTLSEFTDGGYAEYVNVDSEWVVPMPAGLTTREAMALGTAGFTAALCLYRMEQNGQTPEKGPIVVTGASGGVGSFAVQLFSQAGYEVIAVSGKENAVEFLKELGATRVCKFDDLELGERPLEKGLFGGAVDNLGGTALEKLLPHIGLWGNIASVGLAQDAKFSSTVMPFILRGVSLLGASSNNCSQAVRKEVWRKLGSEWKPRSLEKVIQNEVGLEGLNEAFENLLNRETFGRTLVRIT